MFDRQNLLLFVLAVCVLNGIFSPYLKIAIPVTAVLMPELFPRTLEWILFWASIMLSSGTLLVSGIPAALYERWVGDRETTASMWIWLVGAAALSLPVFQRLA
ncbi:MAG TPA: hypothetical protein VFK15_10965 [Burkholderiales bacterium]|jgi:hypothetical protein|nr:hypothetical protein [Burkholderiales bacterium]